MNIFCLRKINLWLLCFSFVFANCDAEIDECMNIENWWLIMEKHFFFFFNVQGIHLQFGASGTHFVFTINLLQINASILRTFFFLLDNFIKISFCQIIINRMHSQFFFVVNRIKSKVEFHFYKNFIRSVLKKK